MNVQVFAKKIKERKRSKKKESMTHMQGGVGGTVTRNCPQESHSTEALNQLFKYIHRAKETIYKETKDIRMMPHHIENINKERQIILKKQPNGISGVEDYNNWNEKFTKGAQKNILACKRISKLEDRSVEIILS